MILENNKERILIKAKSRPIIEIPEEEPSSRELLLQICQAIREGGYNPISQIVGYLVSEDPTHITNYQNARTLISKIDRDDLLEEMVTFYIDFLEKENGKGTDKK